MDGSKLFDGMAGAAISPLSEGGIRSGQALAARSSLRLRRRIDLLNYPSKRRSANGRIAMASRGSVK